ncbi:hypothetical protein O5D80_006435 [Batrachochytrium dendrobatidis]|nr:hypothetical protein O5D80_006435 [Batrachochytrium dendrobatidis]
MSSSVQYLFGNVDEKGNLDKDVLDEDLRETLNSREATEYLDRIFTSVLEIDDSSTGNAADNAFRVQPAADAVDYSNFQELADDQSSTALLPQSQESVQAHSSYPVPFQPSGFPAPFSLQQTVNIQRATDLQDDYDDDGDTAQEDQHTSQSQPAQSQFMPMIPISTIQPFQNIASSVPSLPNIPQIMPFMPVFPTVNLNLSQIPIQAPAKVFTKEQLAKLFPGYDQGRLRFSQLFAGKISKRPTHLRTDISKKLRKDQFYDVMRDDRDLFVKCIPTRLPIESYKQPLPDHSTDNVVAVSEVVESEKLESKISVVDDHLLAPVMLESWEENIVWDINDNDEDVPMDFEMPIRRKDRARFRNTHLDKDDWLEAVVFDEDTPSVKVPFHLDDPRLVISNETLVGIQKRAKNPPASQSLFYKQRPDGKLIDRFNISEDWLYEVTKPRTARVRQTHGPVSIQHSLPAIKMHPQYLKPLLQLRELRSFHRPAFKFIIGEVVQFSRPKAVKKRPKEIDPSDLMRTPKDISLRDTSKFVLVEYSEEYPLLMQTVGMASLIYNYYRKKDEKDNFVPKMNNGGAYILESVDASPFFGFGDVRPGETRQVLYNNLLRAPIFPQNAAPTDFLMIRHSYHGKVKYFIRDIPNMYSVGQIFPVQEVPRPQARKITQSLKQRLQVVSFRLMWKDPFRRLRFDRMKKFFPMFSDLQIRQKLKEFAQYLKKGENTGWWKLKSSVKLPDEDGIRKIITPEQVCLYQSTLVGQQRLRDAGYGNDDLLDLQNEEDESTLDIEVQLAPWVTTKNFVIAASGKGMVRLFGRGDPTGCGEGFSYIRASMKEMFFKSGLSNETKNAFINAKAQATFHKYSIAEQQKEYKEEIDRIWTKQLKSLSCTTIPEDTDPADAELENMRSSKRKLEIEEEKERRRQYGYNDASSPAPFSPPSMRNDNNQYSDVEDEDAGSMMGSTLAGKNKVLVISRMIRNDQGELDWKSEVITDGRVINAYLRHRSIIEKIDEGDENFDISLLSEEERRELRQRKTREHVAQLQTKLGNKPISGNPNEAVHSSSVAPDLDANVLAEQQPSRSLAGANPESTSQTQLHLQTQPLKTIPPVILKLNLGNSSSVPTSAQSNASLLPEPTVIAIDQTTISSRKRRTIDFHGTNSQPTKAARRGSPKIELSNILETIIMKLVGTSGAEPLCQPNKADDYAKMIANPKTLDQIRNDVRNFKYKSHIDFCADIELVLKNCIMYYGSDHPLTAVSRQLVAQVKDYITEHEKDLVFITSAMAMKLASANIPASSIATGDVLHSEDTTDFDSVIGKPATHQRSSMSTAHVLSAQPETTYSTFDVKNEPDVDIE